MLIAPTQRTGPRTPPLHRGVTRFLVGLPRGPSALDAVTAEDVQRVAQDVIASNHLHLAVIGPFEDEERFEKALA